ncbi:hypothetical protein EsHS_00000076 [Epichloe bromicola]
MANGPGPMPLVDVTQQVTGHMLDLPLDDSFALPPPIVSERATNEDWVWGIDQTVRAMDAQPDEANAGVGVGVGVGIGVVEVARWVAEYRRRYTRPENSYTPVSGNEAFPSAARDHAAAEGESQGASSSVLPRPGGNVRPPPRICTSDLYFHGKVTMQPREQAIGFAQAVCEAGSSLGSYALWTGESFSRSRPAAGHSIVSRFRGERWRLRVRRALREREGDVVVCAHLRSIKWALEEAIKHVELWPPTENAASKVRIFTCNEKAVCAIGMLPRCALRGSITGVRARLDMLETISRLSRRLGEMDAKVELHLVPCSRVPGHVMATMAAEYASETPRGLEEEEWTFPSESSTHGLDGEMMAEMDEFDAEFEEEIETEVKTEADADDDTAMANTVLKKEERGEEEEYKVKEAWWVV